MDDFVVYQVFTHPRIAEFAQKVRFPGWYFDSNGSYVCSLGKFLISVFVNSCDNSLDITVDTVGETGYFVTNLEWETAENYDEMVKIARRLMTKYARKV